MLRLFLCTFAAFILSSNLSVGHANDGVPYSEHGDITGQENFDPNEIEPAAGEIAEDNTPGVPYSEHGDITGQENFDPNEIEPAAGEIAEDNTPGVPYSEHGEITE